MGLFGQFLKAESGPVSATESAAVASQGEAERLLEEGMMLESRAQPEEALKRYEAAIHLKPELARAHFNRGNILLDKGDAAGALAAYEQAVKYKPDSAAAHYNIGSAHLRLGSPREAMAACRQAIALKPDFVDAHISLGMALGKLGAHSEAISRYRRAADIRPDSAELHHTLGRVMMESGQKEEAITSFDVALKLRPDYAEAHHNRGIALQDMGRLDEALLAYRNALAINPNFVEAHCNLGSALKELGMLDEAGACYSQALKLHPALAEAHYNLGLVLQKQGKLDDALACYRRALNIKPDDAPVHNALGAALCEREQYQQALEYFRRAIEFEPGGVDGHFNMAITLAAIGQLDTAIASFQQALEIDPDNRDAHLGLGNVFKDLGEYGPALQSVRRALELDPHCVLAHNNLLFIHNYVAGQPPSFSFADAQCFGQVMARLARPYTDWPNTLAPDRRLRIGLVSGDLGDHPVGYFLESVLAALSSQASDRLELFAYSNRDDQDVTSTRLAAHCKDWHSVARLSDEALAQRIREDGIDILIDLSGHTARNRLAMFARKPAPVQLTWLGYLATTGLTAIDYVIADEWTLPKEAEAHFTEKVWRLPGSYICFTPPVHESLPGPLPAITNGYVTFGSCNNLSKMNDDVVDLWSRVLQAVPNSRLLLKSTQLHAASVRKKVIDRFGVHGIDAERLILKALVPRGEHLMTYCEMDIALDPFPYPGITTSVESLWMGVPVLSLAGEQFLSRQGVGLLMNAGLPDWVASDPQDYVARAARHAGDLQTLSSLRSGLRQRVLASPIFDAPRFARHFEDALRGMWRTWCAARPV